MALLRVLANPFSETQFKLVCNAEHYRKIGLTNAARDVVLKIAQAGNPERYSGEIGRGRMGMNWNLTRALEQGQAYHQAWTDYEEGRTSVEPERIRVEGYADTVKLDDSVLEGLSPDERLARHRRVVVRVY